MSTGVARAIGRACFTLAVAALFLRATGRWPDLSYGWCAGFFAAHLVLGSDALAALLVARDAGRTGHAAPASIRRSAQLPPSMAAPPRPLHDELTDRIAEHLRGALLARGLGLRVRTERPLVSPSGSTVRPDVMVVLDGDYSTSRARHALLVVEVALSTRRKDLRRAREFSRRGVPEYWVVHAAGTVVVHRFWSRVGRRYRRYERIQLPSVGDGSAGGTVAALFARPALEGIVERLEENRHRS